MFWSRPCLKVDALRMPCTSVPLARRLLMRTLGRALFTLALCEAIAFAYVPPATVAYMLTRSRAGAVDAA